ncbi:restriction endonuclease subunit S [Streptococcus thermophilus]|nr:restriction endonuclease subunit S [Streptococcus thermophilus]MCE2168092.1 restriction endonuclease subunit S [Streptococcus thermophilus]MCE2174563.1 restriction endonuclease subunit S [Streptococcus thermophilus]
MSEWKSLSSITSKIGSGSTPRGGNSVYSDSGISFIRSQNVLDMDFSTENLAFINDSQAEKLNNVIVEKNDILLNITGDSIARCTVVPEEILPARVNQHVSIIRCKNTEESKYVMYYLQYMKKYLLQISKVGGTRNALTKEAIGKLPIKISDDCNKISKILDNIDKKIQINNKINQELEAMAKTLYDYWFVQFDFPDQNGKPYKSSGGKMVYNQDLKREIPEGWGVEKLGDITICHDSKRVPLSSHEREHVKGEIPYYGATGIMDYVNDYIFDGDYVLMAEDGSVMTEKGTPILQRISGKNWVNNHAHVIEPVKNHSCKLLMMLLKDVSVMKIKTGSIQMKINQENMNKIVVPAIPLELLFEINQRLEVIDKQQLNLIEENKQLTQLRDWILPMLMNGQVKVE